MQVVHNQSYQDYETSVSPKGQVTIPIGTRERLGIRPKDKVTIRVFEDGQIALLPKKHSFLDHYQTVPALETPLSIEEMRQIAREEQLEKYTSGK